MEWSDDSDFESQDPFDIRSVTSCAGSRSPPFVERKRPQIETKALKTQKFSKNNIKTPKRAKSKNFDSDDDFEESGEYLKICFEHKNKTDDETSPIPSTKFKRKYKHTNTLDEDKENTDNNTTPTPTQSTATPTPSISPSPHTNRTESKSPQKKLKQTPHKSTKVTSSYGSPSKKQSSMEDNESSDFQSPDSQLQQQRADACIDSQPLSGASEPSTSHQRVTKRVIDPLYDIQLTPEKKSLIQSLPNKVEDISESDEEKKGETQKSKSQIVRKGAKGKSSSKSKSSSQEDFESEDHEIHRFLQTKQQQQKSKKTAFK